MTIQLNYDNARSFISGDEIAQLNPQVRQLHQNLEEGKGAGNSALGWLHLPSRMAPKLHRGSLNNRRKKSATTVK